MKADIREFPSHSVIVTDEESGIEILFFSAPNDRLIVVTEGEAAVFLSAQEQLALKDVSEWEMLLVAKGMLMPKVTLIAQFLMQQQEHRNAPKQLSADTSAS